MLPPGTPTLTAVWQRPSELIVPRLAPAALSTRDRLEHARLSASPPKARGYDRQFQRRDDPRNLNHQSASSYVDERLTYELAFSSSAPLLGTLRYIPRSCQYRSMNIDIMSAFLYMLSLLFDTLSILIDTETLCGSVSPRKDPLQRTDNRRHSVWLLLSAATRYCCPRGCETFRAARTTLPGAMSHGLVQRNSTVSIRPG